MTCWCSDGEREQTEGMTESGVADPSPETKLAVYTSLFAICRIVLKDLSAPAADLMHNNALIVNIPDL